MANTQTTQQQQEKRMMKSLSTEIIDKEFTNWLNVHDDGLRKSKGPQSVSIYMVDTRNTIYDGVGRSKETFLNDQEEGAHADSNKENEHTTQKIKEKDERINILEEKLEEALRTISLLTKQEQSSQGLIKEPLPQGGSISKGKAQEVEGGSQNPLADGFEGQNPIQVNIDEMVRRSVAAALQDGQGPKIIKKGKPYPAEYESVPYPEGFQSPNFKVFDGTGNPKQHVACFRAQCCNAGKSDALLLKQFVTSLSGAAYDWYSELPNGSVPTFDNMEELFIRRFATTQ